MPKRDELLFGTDPVVTRDSDGDGVSDVQEQLDGTDAADPTDHRSTAPVIDRTQLGDDPRGDLLYRDPGRGAITDVKGTIPSGHSVEQSLGKGLDGKDIATGPRHYGNAQADALLSGHTDSQINPVDVQRDPHIAGLSPSADKGHDPVKDTLGRTSGANTGNDFKAPAHQDGPPPGQTPSGSADGTDGALVGKEIPQAKNLTADQRGQTPAAGDSTKKSDMKDFDKAKEATTATPEKGLVDTVTDGAKSLYNWATKDVNPDADTGTGTPTDADVKRAVTIHGATSQPVNGQGGATAIESSTPPKSPGDLVTNPSGDGDSGTQAVTTATVVAPPHQDISHPVIPNTGVGTGQDPHGGGGGQGGGNGGQGDGRASASYAATAASDATADAPANSGGDTSSDTRDTTSDTTASDTTASDTPTSIPIDHTRQGEAVTSDAAPREAAPVLVGGPHGDDPRGDLDRPDLSRETTIDVTGMVPDGHSLEQTLPTGLDGTAIPTTPNHYGNAQADDMLAGRADTNSPLNMSRDPLVGTLAPSAPEGRNPTTEKLGRDAGPAASDSSFRGTTHHDGPPPGQEPSGSADPTGNMDLVSRGGGAKGFKMVEVPRESTPRTTRDAGSAPAPTSDAGTTPTTPDAGTAPAPAPAPAPASGAPPIELKEFDPAAATKAQPATSGTSEFQKALDRAGGNKSSDPDAVDDAPPTTEEVARAVVVHGAATDVVEGRGGAQIEGNAPPRPAGDLVTDPGDGDQSTGVVVTTAVTPPHQDISHPVNPNPNTGVGGGQGTGAGSGTGSSGNDGRASSSAAATATQAVDDAGATDTTDTTDATDTTDGPLETPSVPDVGEHAPAADATLAADDADDPGVLSAPDDPVADAMTTMPELSVDATGGSFANLDIDDGLAIPAEPDLDDGF